MDAELRRMRRLLVHLLSHPLRRSLVKVLRHRGTRYRISRTGLFATSRSQCSTGYSCTHNSCQGYGEMP